MALTGLAAQTVFAIALMVLSCLCLGFNWRAATVAALAFTMTLGVHQAFGFEKAGRYLALLIQTLFFLIIVVGGVVRHRGRYPLS